MPTDTPCPCGRQSPQRRPLLWLQCCGRYVDAYDTLPAPDAESLMRSRYRAFVRENAAYLLATWHARTRPAQLDFYAKARWLGLEVRMLRSTGPDRAEVEFIARYRLAGRAVRLHELSRFEREAGRWYYVDGDQS